MWFAKWFGGGSEVEETDEPARFAAPPTPVAQQSAPTSVGNNNKKARTGKGFDPYNSGSFEKRNAWERVSKR